MIPTVREFLPWHVIEQKMAQKAAANPQNLDGVPDSGVYTSGEHPASANLDEPGRDPGGLSYRVYTLAELAGRSVAPPVSSRTAAPLAPAATYWPDTWAAALVVLRMAKVWLSASSPRPPATDVLRAPVVAFRSQLRLAVRHAEWRKIATGAVLALGAFFLLLFVVLTAADLTDDLKPARGPIAKSTGEAYTNAIVAASHTSKAPRRGAPPSAHAPAPVDDLEVSVDTRPAATPAPAPVTGRKGGRPAKKAPAAAVFNP